MAQRHARKWCERFVAAPHGKRIDALKDLPGRGKWPRFPPLVQELVRVNVVKMACERPDVYGRSLGRWNCPAIVRELIRCGIVSRIGVETVRQILLKEHLKPWRHQMWLSRKVKRDVAFALAVLEIAEPYTRELDGDQMVVCVDEKTNLQPRLVCRRRGPASRPG